MKEQDRVSMPVALLLLVLALAISSCATQAAHPDQAATSPSNEGGIPDSARERALQEFSSEMGPVRKVYGEGETTFGNWADVEPNNTMAVDSSNETAIYALYVEGDFTVLGPMTSNGEAIKVDYIAGRIVFRESGKNLLQQLWETRRSAQPAFRPALDD